MMQDSFMGPVNIGSEEMVTINHLVEITAEVAGKSISVKHIDGPTGVRGRNSSNDLIRKELDWDYQITLKEGMNKSYDWIFRQVTTRDSLN